MTPDDLKKLYEEETGEKWDDGAGVTWLCKNYARLDIFTKKPVLDKSAHVTLSDKAGWLSQQPCHVCRPASSVSVIPLRIRPESWQSLNSVDKTAFKAALAHRFSKSAHIEALTGRICLTFLFVCSARRRVRDLDNMAKLVMDSLKGIVMGDDREVDHLNLMRLAHEGEEEYVVFRISDSNLNDHRDTVRAEVRHSWAGAEALRIEDFRSRSV